MSPFLFKNVIISPPANPSDNKQCRSAFTTTYIQYYSCSRVFPDPPLPSGPFPLFRTKFLLVLTCTLVSGGTRWSSQGSGSSAVRMPWSSPLLQPHSQAMLESAFQLLLCIFRRLVPPTDLVWELWSCRVDSGNFLSSFHDCGSGTADAARAGTPPCQGPPSLSASFPSLTQMKVPSCPVPILPCSSVCAPLYIPVTQVRYASKPL